MQVRARSRELRFSWKGSFVNILSTGAALESPTPINKRQIDKVAAHLSPELEDRLRVLADRLHDFSLHVRDLDDGPLSAAIEDALDALREAVGVLDKAVDALEVAIERG